MGGLQDSAFSSLLAPRLLLLQQVVATSNPWRADPSTYQTAACPPTRPAVQRRAEVVLHCAPIWSIAQGMP